VAFTLRFLKVFGLLGAYMISDGQRHDRNQKSFSFSEGFKITNSAIVVSP
jgi:hypothetical protein